MKFLNVRKGREEREIIVDVAKTNKRPILYSLTIDVNEWIYHQCGGCIYNRDCKKECKVLESSFAIQGFVRENFGINLLNLSLVPIKKNEVTVSKTKHD